ncbi:MAG: hypothetical protein HPY90_05610 [Syntrophothermus sp.]|uniref:hypothetical protein n=1 Tax=Syntrophothermus sp. TaxID=2736299 RepID=UPI00257E1D06|nr:hypothetical protein [Syntrophothermus sp.]NSW82741.1 hypothetical protein [Syntrophothermus sp.]
MKPNGHTATVEFKEDWAMDGANIYNMIKDEYMAVSPKYYTLTANWNVWYQYQYVAGYDENGNPIYETGTGATSGTTTGKLLVNGTGVNSLAE